MDDNLEHELKILSIALFEGIARHLKEKDPELYEKLKKQLSKYPDSIDTEGHVIEEHKALNSGEQE